MPSRARGRTSRSPGATATCSRCNLPVFGRTVIVADPQLAKQLFIANTDDVGNIQPNLSPGARLRFGVRPRRCGPSPAPQAADAAVPRQEHQELREDLRRGDAARVGDLAGGSGVRDPRADDADHAQRHPARGVRRRRRTARRASPHHPAVGHPGLAVGGAARPRRGLTAGSARGAGSPNTDGSTTRLSTGSSTTVKADPNFDSRDDVLALLLRSTYEDGSAMSRQDIGDELLTLLARRPRDHGVHAGVGVRADHAAIPTCSPKLVEEAGTDGQRVPAGHHPRGAARAAPSSTSPAGTSTRRRSSSANGLSRKAIRSSWRSRSCTTASQEFPDPERFDPQRFVGTRPPTFAFLPFGGGTRRCVGAAFANVEMDVVLRTVLRHFIIETTTAPDEKVHSRGVAYTPKDGGRIDRAPPRPTPAWLDVSRAWAASSRPAGSGRCSPLG